jgi:hypothetical protein
MLDDITPLKERWLELYPKFTDYREKLLATVERWEWANGPRYDPRPFYFQRELARGRLLRHAPANEDRALGAWYCGYDSQDRMIVSRRLNGKQETFYSFTDVYIESFTFQTYLGLYGISRLYFANGHPSYFLSFSITGNPELFHGSVQEIRAQSEQGTLGIFVEREDYEYSDALITLIKLIRWNNAFHYVSDQSFEMEYRLHYDSKRDLERITYQVLSSDYVRTMYQKRQPGETLQTLAERAQSKLMKTIPEVIRQAKFTEPLYCVQLQYKDYGMFFPPVLQPGLESKRQHILETIDSRHIPNSVWVDPWYDLTDENEPYPPFPIEDAESLEACDRFQIEVSGERLHFPRFRLAIRTLRQIARALNQLDWSAYAPVTPDFIVFTNDQEDIAMSLRLSGATPDQLASWRKRGLL